MDIIRVSILPMWARSSSSKTPISTGIWIKKEDISPVYKTNYWSKIQFEPNSPVYFYKCTRDIGWAHGFS